MRGELERLPRLWAWRGLLCAAVAAAAVSSLDACRSAGPTAEGPPDGRRAASVRADDGARFDARRAWRDVERIASERDRAAGTKGARKAREYVHEQLEDAGAEIETLVLEVATEGDAGDPSATTSFTTLLGRLAGDSEDVFLLAAHYDAAPLPAGDEVSGAAQSTREHAYAAASGPALLLELTRQLAERPRPYTVWLAFIEGDAIEGDAIERDARAEGAADAGGDGSGAAARFLGSRAFAAWLAEQGGLERIRIAVYFEAIARPDLVVARDLLSHRAHREVFWQSARGLGDAGIFASEGEYDRVETGHLALLASGMRRVVAIAPSDRLHEPDAGMGAGVLDDEKEMAARARANLAHVGEVALLSLETIADRLERIDGFAESPLTELPGESPSPSALAGPGSPGPSSASRPAEAAGSAPAPGTTSPADSMP